MIDTTKLTRDFEILPLLKNEKLNKEDLEYLFIDLNMSEIEISNYLNRNRNTIRTWSKSYGIKKNKDSINKIRNNTLKKKYNIDHQSQLSASSEYLSFSKLSREEAIIFIKENNIKNTFDLSNKLNCCLTSITRYLVPKFELQEILYKKNSSHFEEEIVNLLKKEIPTIKIIKNDRVILEGKEIDILLPEYNIGIEFNGNLWHNENALIEKKQNPIFYHQNKSLLAKSKGIFLYHIFEYEWEKIDLILSHIMTYLNKNKKIFARKCSIKKIEDSEAKCFLNENHLQGHIASKYSYGLLYENELVEIMTFGKPRFSKLADYELLRLCSKKGISIIGGASRLLKFFIKEVNPNSILSYSHIHNSKSVVYEKLSFECIKTSFPSYKWINEKGMSLSRYSCQKKKIESEHTKNLTEKIIMEEKGFSRIFDAGNFVWLWKKK